jgi:hypothetical protein
MSRLPVYALLLTAALSGASCSSDDPDPGPSAPAPVEIIESVTGTLTVNGAATHSFVVERVGDITAVLLTVTADPVPDPTPALSIALGTWNGVSCAIAVANDKATPVAGGTPAAINSVIGRATVVGNFCLRVVDPGTLTRAVSYDVQLRHY